MPQATPLSTLHCAHGARMVAFAGYNMPLQYSTGIVHEHLHTRQSASLFDISHMGQILVRNYRELEYYTPADLQELPEGRQLYTQLLNGKGGIVDDLMITREPNDQWYLVVNAARKTMVLQLLADAKILEVFANQALIALQGPQAANVIAAVFNNAIAEQPFLSQRQCAWQGVPCRINRCGYTGEDGFEISLPANAAEDFARALLNYDTVALAGLGARDLLRLEAGFCLYGNDIDETTTPIEAGLGWSIGKRRRQQWGFNGDIIIREHLKNGVARKRIGIQLQGRQPARAGTEICDSDGTVVGKITSGGFSPTLGHPVAMGYAPANAAAIGTPLNLTVRDKRLSATVTKMPFVPARYFRGAAKVKENLKAG